MGVYSGYYEKMKSSSFSRPASNWEPSLAHCKIYPTTPNIYIFPSYTSIYIQITLTKSHTQWAPHPTPPKSTCPSTPTRPSSSSDAASFSMRSRTCMSFMLYHFLLYVFFISIAISIAMLMDGMIDKNARKSPRSLLERKLWSREPLLWGFLLSHQARIGRRMGC